MAHDSHGGDETAQKGSRQDHIEEAQAKKTQAERHNTGLECRDEGDGCGLELRVLGCAMWVAVHELGHHLPDQEREGCFGSERQLSAASGIVVADSVQASVLTCMSQAFHTPAQGSQWTTDQPRASIVRGHWHTTCPMYQLKGKGHERSFALAV